MKEYNVKKYISKRKTDLIVTGERKKIDEIIGEM